MTKLKDKLKLIYLPFLIIAICFIAAYTLLHWLFFIKAEIPLKEDIVKIWLPFGLLWIPILIWLRPKINLLEFKKYDFSFTYQIIASIAIAIPTIIAQEYLATATGKLSKLDNISEIEKTEKTKYYTLQKYYIDKQKIGVQHTTSVSGKYNEDLNMSIYVAMPIFENIKDTVNLECTSWLGKKYSEQISNRLSDEEKDNAYKKFVAQSQEDFDTANFTNFSYLEVIGNTKDHDEYINAIKNAKLTKTKDQIVFLPIKKPFEKRIGNKLEWIFGSLGIGMLVWFILLLFPKLNKSNSKKPESYEKIKSADLKAMFGFLWDQLIFFYVTSILVIINTLVFITMFFAGISFKAADLLNWGANFRPITTNGQWWRLLTNIFLHADLMHLLANMCVLIFVGIFIEQSLGKIRYLVIYLTTGILASVASIWWHSATVSVGASGAIFGLYGFLLAAILLKNFPISLGKDFVISILTFVGFNLLMGITGDTDNAAHIGGLLSGFVIGLALSGQIKASFNDQ